MRGLQREQWLVSFIIATFIVHTQQLHFHVHVQNQKKPHRWSTENESSICFVSVPYDLQKTNTSQGMASSGPCCIDIDPLGWFNESASQTSEQEELLLVNFTVHVNLSEVRQYAAEAANHLLDGPMATVVVPLYFCNYPPYENRTKEPGNQRNRFLNDDLQQSPAQSRNTSEEIVDSPRTNQIDPPIQPPTILIVSNGMKIFVGVISVLGGSFALFCLVFIVQHRDHPVMTLAQGSFLAAFTAACLVHIAFTFTLLPTRHIFCTLRRVFLLIAINFQGAILIARVWRAYSTLAMVNTLGRKSLPSGEKQEGETILKLCELYVSFLGCLARFPLLCSNRQRKTALRSTLRPTVTGTETATLVVMLTLPQFTLQVFGAIYYNQYLEVQMEACGGVGRIICTADGAWVLYVGVALAGLCYAGAVTMAWIARILPSVFNEKDRVFRASFISCLLIFLTVSLYAFADDPSDSPDILVFLISLCSIGNSMSGLVIIIFPNIKRVWSGEKVVMTAVLGSRFSDQTCKINAVKESPPVTEEVSLERVCLEEGDPLPRAMEEHVFTLSNLLRGVESKCCDGRPLTAQEFSELRDCIHKFDSELGRVDLVGPHGDCGIKELP